MNCNYHCDDHIIIEICITAVHINILWTALFAWTKNDYFKLIRSQGYSVLVIAWAADGKAQSKNYIICFEMQILTQMFQ